MVRHGRMRHLWDHAILLLELGYDWLTALYIFDLLLQRTSNQLVKAALLLNMGMIHFQLADHSEAEQMFKEALPLGPVTAPLANFLLGLLRFETGDYRQANISFKVCANVLHQTNPEYDYRPFGLDYVLREQEVLENEVSAAYEWAHEFKGTTTTSHRVLYRVSASSMFGSAVLDHSVGATVALSSDKVDNPVQPKSFLCHACPSPIHGEDHQERAGATSVRMTLQNPRKVLHDEPTMVARAAVIESPDLAMLAQFLKSTGPQDVDDNAMEPQGPASPPPIPPLPQKGLSKTSQPFKKVSLRTFERVNSIRHVTRHAFSTSLSRMHAFPNESETAFLLGDKKVQRTGPPERMPVIRTDTSSVSS